MHIFKLPCATDVRLVSLYSLKCQLSFKTQRYMFAVCTTVVINKNDNVGHLIDLYRSQKVKSEVVPYCKLAFVIKKKCDKFMLCRESTKKS